MTVTPAPTLTARITTAKQYLDWVRLEGDDLTIELAEAALNDLLDRLAKEGK